MAELFGCSVFRHGYDYAVFLADGCPSAPVVMAHLSEYVTGSSRSESFRYAAVRLLLASPTFVLMSLTHLKSCDGDRLCSVWQK